MSSEQERAPSKIGGVTKWKRGVSGNPGGRPKEVAELKALAREHTAYAIEKLVHHIGNKDPRISLVAIGMLLDRGYGKPAQQYDVSSTHDATLSVGVADNLQLARQIAHVLTVAGEEQAKVIEH